MPENHVTFPRGFVSAKHVEAHLLDAHGIHDMTRQGLGDLIVYHDGLHAHPNPELLPRVPHDHAKADHAHVPSYWSRCSICGQGGVYAAVEAV